MVDQGKVRAHYLKKNVAFSLVSNLTLMTEEKLSRIIENGVDVCTSLDGDRFNHNNNRT
jgi:sulfatase maturation enzyme AslB (radical SAM superfamily)